MRRLSSFLLTGLVLVNLFGFYIVFVIKQADIKEEMAEKTSNVFSNDHRQIFSFDKDAFAALSFEDDGKELRLDGKLYDIVSIENSGSNTDVTVEYDAKETALDNAFGALWGNQQGKDQTSPVKTFISHFQQDYLANDHAVYVINNPLHTGYNIVDKAYPPLYFVAGNLTPPPQFFLV